MNDGRGRQFREGDIIIYGYGYWSAPVVGVVKKVMKKGIKFEYIYRNRWDGTEQVSTTICKKPECALIINPIAKHDELLELFGVKELIKNNKVNTDLITMENKNESKEGIEDIERDLSQI
jgi:hypothetical protein